MLSPLLYDAIEAVLYVALQSTVAPVPGKAVCQAQGLNPRYLEPVLQRLVREGILRSIRGPKGGYTLGRDRRKITLYDIYHIVAEMEKERMHGVLPATPLRKGTVEPMLEDMVHKIVAGMQDIVLDTLYLHAYAQLLPHEKPDFAI